MMKKQSLFYAVVLVVGYLTVSLVGCGEKEAPALTLVSLEANGIDLNGATSPSNVPTSVSITATFNERVDAASTGAITLVRQYDSEAITLQITVAENVVTIVPQQDFTTGALYVISFGAGLSSNKGKGLTASIDRNFTTLGTFAVPGAVAHYTFEDNASDIAGNFNPTASQIVDITYVQGRKAEAGKAASFNGTTSIIEIPNADQFMNPTGSWSISFWMRTSNHTDNENKGHFVMGLGAFFGFQFEIFGGYGGFKMPVAYRFINTEREGWTAEDNAFNGDGRDASNGGWQGFSFTRDLTASGGVQNIIRGNWTHVVYTYNASTKTGTYYLNGERMRELNFNLWPAGDIKTSITGTTWAGTAPEVTNELALGFVKSRASNLWSNEEWGNYANPGANHYKGLMDDLIIYHKPLSAAEVGLMYNSGKP